MSYNPYGTMPPHYYEDDEETWIVKENEPTQVLNKKDFSYQPMTFNEIQRKHHRKMNEINKSYGVEPWTQTEIKEFYMKNVQEHYNGEHDIRRNDYEKQVNKSNQYAQYEVDKVFGEYLEEPNEVVDKFIIWPRYIDGKWRYFETVECERKWNAGWRDERGRYEVIEYRKKWKLKDKYIEVENAMRII